jgi:hypothetical protein
MRSRCSRLSPGGVSGAGMCSARHFAQLIGSGVISSPILSFERVNGLVRHASFDHLVGAGEQRWRHVEAESLGGLEIDHQFEFGRQLDRQIGRYLAFEDAINVTGRATVLVERATP